jgi:hypothetical protein
MDRAQRNRSHFSARPNTAVTAGMSIFPWVAENPPSIFFDNSFGYKHTNWEQHYLQSVSKLSAGESIKVIIVLGTVKIPLSYVVRSSADAIQPVRH